MSNGDIWEDRREKVKKDLEKELEKEDDESDLPIHEKRTRKGKFPKEEE